MFQHFLINVQRALLNTTINFTISCWECLFLAITFTAGFVVAEMLSFLRRTLGRRSMRKHAEKERLREAQRAATHIPAAGDAKSIITCRVSLLDGTDVSVDLPVSRLLLAASCVWDHYCLCFLGVGEIGWVWIRLWSIQLCGLGPAFSGNCKKHRMMDSYWCELTLCVSVHVHTLVFL